MKAIHLIIPLFVPVVSVAQSSAKASLPHSLLLLAKIDSIKTDYGPYSPLIRSENASIGNGIKLSARLYYQPSDSAKVIPSIDSGKGNPVDLALVNLVLLEKINVLTQQRIKLEKENQLRMGAVRQQQDITVKLQEEIKQLKQMLQQ
ncbi:hypothetical protein GCM10028805_03630 [Spirosoma harenae]